MPPAPKHSRRWMQFGMGTMFVVVTVFALWLAWELNFIRERRIARARIVSVGGLVADSYSVTNSVIPGIGYAPELPPSAIPFWRRWLGDEAITAVILRQGTMDADVAKHLFPEAEVHWKLLPRR